MKVYNRNGKLYIRVKGIRKSTGLDYTKENIKLVSNYHGKDEFFNNFNITVNNKTIIDYCNDVILEKRKRLKVTSIRSYESLLSSRIVPYFDKMYPHEVTPKMIKEYYGTFKDKATLNTTINGILKNAFEFALIDGAISKSPFVVSFPTLKSDYEMKPFNLSEIQLILSNASNWFKNFLGVAFFTGMRTGEILALKWSDIDFNDSSININATRTDGKTLTPKTKSSERIIDILSQCESFLIEQRKASGLSTFVFPSRDGKMFYGSTSLDVIWRKLLAKCGIEYRSIYQTRHTFASNMLSNKEDAIWVSSMLGHKSLNITLEKYTKFIRIDRKRKHTFLDTENIEFSSNMAQ
jgi:integrase